MWSSKNGFKSVHNTEEFVKESVEFGNKDIALVVVHDSGCMEFVFNPTLDSVEGIVYHFLNDGTEQVYKLKPRHLANEEVTSPLIVSSVLHSYLAEAYKIADMFRNTMRQSTDYAS